MTKLIVLFCALVVAEIATAQEYSTLLIPDSLRKGADVVKRSEEYILTIKSSSQYTIYERHAYTILNSNAAKFAKYTTGYDKFCSINSIPESCTIY